MSGDGLARPVGLGSEATLSLSPPMNFGSREWGGQKLLWALSPLAQPPVLVRGHQLDGDSEIRFNNGDVPADELVLDPAVRNDTVDGGWYDFPGFTRLRGPGCYGFQIDEASSTSFVYFRATK